MKQTLSMRASEHGHPFSAVVTFANRLRITACVIAAVTALLTRRFSDRGDAVQRFFLVQ